MLGFDNNFVHVSARRSGRKITFWYCTMTAGVLLMYESVRLSVV